MTHGRSVVAATIRSGNCAESLARIDSNSGRFPIAFSGLLGDQLLGVPLRRRRIDQRFGLGLALRAQPAIAHRDAGAIDAGAQPQLAAGQRRDGRARADNALERVSSRGRPARLPAIRLGRLAQLRPTEGELFIQAVRLRLRVPEVITVTGFDRLPTAAVAFSRRNVFKRDHYTCQYCSLQCRSPWGKSDEVEDVLDSNPRADKNRPRRQPGTEELSIDHVIPRSQGGTSTWENCVLACVACNKRKADRTPHQAGMKLRRPPTRPTWKPLYAAHRVRIASWAKFISEAYWNVELES